MARTRTIYRCESCGAAHPKWSGQCSACEEWNTLVEEIEGPRASAASYSGPAARAVPLASVDPSAARMRATGISEVDRVLGGGLVAGSVTLLGGEPGIGKSTLTLQMLMALAAEGR